MNRETNIDLMSIEICELLIDRGVKKYVAWGMYISDFRSIGKYFELHGYTNFDAGMLDAYRKHIKQRLDNEEICQRRYVALIRAVNRLREYYNTGDIDHIVANGNSRRKLNARNEEILNEFIASCPDLQPKSIEDAGWAVRAYLHWLQTQGVYDALDSTVHSFAGYMASVANRYTDGTLHDIQLYLKKFHAFLKAEKGVDIPFEFVLSRPITRTKRIFKPLTYDEIQRTIAQIDRSTIKGKRDFAIIMIAARCGLRGIDIINLKLKDIDWRKKEVRIVQKKTGVAIAVPLLEDAADALKVYILEARPVTESEYVFLRAVRPYNRFTKTVVLSHILFKYQNLAGIERCASDGRGFHSFRRTLGKALTLAEVPVTVTAEILGHSDIGSAKHYISLDSEHLKECALDFTNAKIEWEGIWG